MSKETRNAYSAKLQALESVRGHESTIAHAFNHTGGKCPKCSCDQHIMAFCFPDSRERFQNVPGCELDGEHIHRVCGACKYPWIERPWDQLILSQSQGELAAESDMATTLAALVHRAGGVTMAQALVGQYRGWIIRFTRNPQEGTLEISAEPAPEQTGKPAHPQLREGGAS